MTMKWSHVILVIFSMVIVLIQKGEGAEKFKPGKEGGTQRAGELCTFVDSDVSNYDCIESLVCTWSDAKGEARCTDPKTAG